MNDQKSAEEARNNRNNTQTVRNAADVAIASKHPVAAAAGGAVKAADKVTGGKASETIGKGLTQANKMAPGGKQLQGLTNKVNESGLGDKAGQAARMYNGAKGNMGSELAKQPTGNNMDTIGRGRDEPSSSLNDAHSYRDASGRQQTPENSDEAPRIAGIGPFGKQPGSNRSDQESTEEDKKSKTSNSYSLFGSREAKIVVALTLPFLGLMLIIVFLGVAASAVFGGNFEDALGAGQASGEDMGSAEFYDDNNKDAQEYYERINNVKLDMQAEGKTFDSLDIVSVFHILMDNGAKLTYKDITEDKIREVAEALFSGSTYDKDHFKEELAVRIIPKYLPKKTDEEIEDLIAEIDQYVSDYNEYVERSVDSSQSYRYSTCGGVGSCTYNVKGFYINGKNVSNSMELSNLQVRLMQCGSPYGNGDDNTPINQDLVGFEEYAGGVAYAEIGDSSPIEAYKAQLVMARSFALARPTALGNTAGRRISKKGNGHILQIASCVSDQVYCNVDKGCSYMGGGDGQGGYVVSGTNVSGAERTRPPLSGSHELRTAMSQTQGEVLTNQQGYILSTDYNSTTQKQMISLANKGLNYKQILLKLYPNASNVDKMSCSGASNCRVSTGEYANWKQCGASWSNVPMGNSGNNICNIGCLVTSVSMLIAKSGVPTNTQNFNPGTFVDYLNANGGFAAGGNFLWNSATGIAPSFKYQGKMGLSGLTREQKFNKISSELQAGSYLACEVKGNTGQHWVVADSISGNQINMLDPGSNATNMWQQYNPANTSECAIYRVG